MKGIMIMNSSNSIKKEAIVLAVCVIVLAVIVIGVSYSYFMSIDSGEDNVISIGDLRVSFCVDETCDKNYANFGQVIGTKTVDEKSVIESIYPYETNEEALETHPYIFNIKNTGTLKTYVTIRLKEDVDYVLGSGYENYVSLTTMYSDHIKVAVSECNDKINRGTAIIYTYGDLIDNILVADDVFENGQDKTYCLWTYLDNTTPNEVQNTYFVANLVISAEYRPNAQ